MYDVLTGIRVIDLSAWVFAPSGTAILADWGADVIKIEDVEAPDPARGLRSGLDPGVLNATVEFANRGKRSLGLDIRTEGGQKALHRLIASADVFVTNMRGRAIDRLKIDVDSLRAVNPKLIYVRALGWGRKGPMADKAAFDLSTAWAAGGGAYMATRKDRDSPAFQPGSFGDITGGTALAGAVTAALLKRERTGVPPVVDVSLMAIGMWMMGSVIGMGALGTLYEPFKQEEPLNALTNAYKTRDGRWIYFTVLQSDRYWESFCEHIGLNELINDPRFSDSNLRLQNTIALAAILNERFAELTLEEWAHRLDTFDGVWSPALSPVEVLDHPQVRANGYITDVSYDALTYPVVASPAQFDQQPLGPVRRAPKHGEHTDEIMMELGLSSEEILELKIEGALL